MKKSLHLIIACVVFVLAVASCQKETNVSGIKVAPQNLTLSKNETAQLYYVITPYGSDDKTVNWTSQNPAVATVSNSGLVTTVDYGETCIIATTVDGHFSDTVSITVVPGSPKGDSIALLNLYSIANNLPYWDLSQPMNTWEGVVLNNNRRVVQITGKPGYSTIIISKPLDATIGNLNCLTQLSLEVANGVYNITIPPELGMLTELRWLSMVYGFIGNIPPELGNLKNLTGLYLSYNQLSGSIPLELGDLVQLEYLALAYNGLTGNIPPELGNLSNLTRLDMENNPLSGNIPPELGNLSNLTGLALDNNQLSGNIPPELGNLSNLTQLDLSNNQLSGNIPPELGNLSNINILYLYHNQLTGSIPEQLANLTQLWKFYVSDNSLSGTIPQALLDKFGPYVFCPQNGTKFDNLDCGGY
jgi:Leucine-rich repeat (LRR) protein